jgi:CBS domain-containing protein
MATPKRSLREVKVSRYMASHLVTFTADMEIMQAVHVLIRHKISGAPVVDAGGKLIGMLSEKDCLRVAVLADKPGFDTPLVGDYMATKVDTVSPDTDLFDVASHFAEVSYKRFPVVDKGRLVGQISRTDVLRAIDDLGLS